MQILAGYKTSVKQRFPRHGLTPIVPGGGIGPGTMRGKWLSSDIVRTVSRLPLIYVHVLYLVTHAEFSTPTERSHDSSSARLPSLLSPSPPRSYDTLRLFGVIGHVDPAPVNGTFGGLTVMLTAAKPLDRTMTGADVTLSYFWRGRLNRIARVAPMCGPLDDDRLVCRCTAPSTMNKMYRGVRRWLGN
jgi:hypothetical protein